MPSEARKELRRSRDHEVERVLEARRFMDAKREYDRYLGMTGEKPPLSKAAEQVFLIDAELRNEEYARRG